MSTQEPENDLLDRCQVTACPGCGADAMPAFFSISSLPVHGTAVFATAEQATATVTGDQDLALCPHCGLVFNRSFDPTRLDYTGTHEESQHGSPRFVEYAATLSSDWVRRYGLSGSHVVEVGCGAGDFAAELVRSGVGLVTGIDPHFRADRVPVRLHGRLIAVPRFFESGMVTPGTAAIVCRHTVEHVAQPSVFCREIHVGMQSASVPILLAEVPDLTRILSEGAFWDLHYEHCNYFTPTTMANCLQRAGFTTPHTRSTYDGQYIVAEAAPGPGPSDEPLGRVDLDALVQMCESFRSHVNSQIIQWADRLDDSAAAGDAIVVWGGGSKGLTFLNALASHTAAVECVIDINPGLQNRFIGGLGLPIHAPRHLVSSPPRSVVLMNGIYEREVRDMLDDFGLHTTALDVLA
jgi:hypothetical protein